MAIVITNDNIHMLINRYYRNKTLLPPELRNITDWDISQVTNLADAFSGKTRFNEPLNWVTTQVTNMSNMFSGCTEFNQPLTSFDTSNVTTMASMFAECSAFNQPLNHFRTDNVTDMSYMFYMCSFNQPLNQWSVQNVTDIEAMFAYGSFNQDISNWNVSNVVNMAGTFDGCPLDSHPPAWYGGEEEVDNDTIIDYTNVTPNPITASTTSIPDDAVGMDIIEGVDVNIKQYLRENADGFVFLSYTKYYPIEKEQIMHVINSNSSAIKYICANEGSVGSANKTVPYLNCKTLGLTTDLLVPLSQIKTMLTNNVRAVEIIPGEQTPFTVSLGVLNNTVDDWLGASHCQAGQGGTLSTLQELQNTMSDAATNDAAISGGRTKKRRTKKRRTKKRRTKKRRIMKMKMKR